MVYVGRKSRIRRHFGIPKSINPGKIEAVMVDGVLGVRVPKMEKAKPRRIPIKAGDQRS